MPGVAAHRPRWPGALACGLALLSTAACSSARPPARPSPTHATAGGERVTVEMFGAPIYDQTLNVDEYVSAHEVEAPADQLFTAVLAAYDAAGIAVRGAETTAGRVDSGLLRVRGRLGREPLSRYLSCGSANIGDNADRYEVTLRMRSIIVPQAGGTSALRSVLVATGANPGNGGASVRCTSTGRLEERIATAAMRAVEKG